MVFCLEGRDAFFNMTAGRYLAAISRRHNLRLLYNLNSLSGTGFL
jgi:hypothetical protein